MTTPNPTATRTAVDALPRAGELGAPGRFPGPFTPAGVLAAAHHAQAVGGTVGLEWARWLWFWSARLQRLTGYAWLAAPMPDGRPLSAHLRDIGTRLSTTAPSTPAPTPAPAPAHAPAPSGSSGSSGGMVAIVCSRGRGGPRCHRVVLPDQPALPDQPDQPDQPPFNPTTGEVDPAYAAKYPLE